MFGVANSKSYPPTRNFVTLAIHEGENANIVTDQCQLDSTLSLKIYAMHVSRSMRNRNLSVGHILRRRKN